jgi:hypothetical protein
MFGNLFPSRTEGRSERPTFKPYLESLERREVPTCAQTSAAFDALPGDFNNLQANINARSVSGIDTSFNTLATNLFQLQFGAPGFRVGDRLRIDSAQITVGLSMIFTGFQNFAFIPIPQFENIVQLGATAAQNGFQDFLFVGFFPQTSGNCVLT